MPDESCEERNSIYISPLIDLVRKVIEKRTTDVQVNSWTKPDSIRVGGRHKFTDIPVPQATNHISRISLAIEDAGNLTSVMIWFFHESPWCEH